MPSAQNPGPAHDSELRCAMREAAAQLDAAQAAAQPLGMTHALVQVARCYAALQMLPTAESSLQQAVRWCRMTGSTDALAELLCELSETAARLARVQDQAERSRGFAARERARDHAFEASTLAGRVADPGWEAQLLLRISDVLDSCGDRDDAVHLQTRALQLMSGTLAAGRVDPRLLPSLGRLADS